MAFSIIYRHVSIAQASVGERIEWLMEVGGGWRMLCYVLFKYCNMLCILEITPWSYDVSVCGHISRLCMMYRAFC